MSENEEEWGEMGFKYVLEKGDMLSKFNRARDSLSDMVILLKGLDEAISITPECRTEPLYVEYRSKMVGRIQVLMRNATTKERLSARIACENTMKTQPKMVRFEKIFLSGFVNSLLECEDEAGREKTVVHMSMDYMYIIYKDFGTRYFGEEGHDHENQTANDMAVLDIMKDTVRALKCLRLSFEEFRKLMTKLLLDAGGKEEDVPLAGAQSDKPATRWRFVGEDVKAELIRDNASIETIHCHIYYPQITLGDIILSYDS
jgi:hypothetical protein